MATIYRQMLEYTEKIASFDENLPTGDSAGGSTAPPVPRPPGPPSVRLWPHKLVNTDVNVLEVPI